MDAKAVTRVWRCDECQIEWHATADDKAAVKNVLVVLGRHSVTYHRGKGSIVEMPSKDSGGSP